MEVALLYIHLDSLLHLIFHDDSLHKKVLVLSVRKEAYQVIHAKRNMIFHNLSISSDKALQK